MAASGQRSTGTAGSLGLTAVQSASVVSTVRAIALSDGEPMGVRSGRLLDILARALNVGEWRALPGPEDLTRVFLSPSERRAFVDALVVAACIEGEVTEPRRVAVEAIARELEVQSHWVTLLEPLRRRNVLAVKRAIVTRSPDARRIFARLWEEEGLRGIFRAFVFMLGLHRDPTLAARFHALANLPAGSFGRAVADHFAARKLAYPGERGGMPERMIHHDLMHVLNGYDTDAAGECELAGFYAGHSDGDAFTFIVIVLATFHLGLRVSPSVVTPARGAFDPERVLTAFLRGRRLSVDVMGRWNYWELMPLPIEQVRVKLGISGNTPLS